MVTWEHNREAGLLRLEQAKDTKGRVEAVEALRELALSVGPARARELQSALPGLLVDEAGEVRAAAVALAAAVLAPGELQDLLAARLADEDPEVRAEATAQLAHLARPDTRGLLARALEDEEFEVRFEAACGMAALHHPAGLEVLLEGVEDARLRFRAIGALGELGDARALPAVRKVFRKWFLSAFERTQAAAVLARLGEEEGVRHLLKRLGRGWTPDRAMAAELAGEVQLPGARERLLALLADGKEPARGAAARGLGRLGDASVLSALTAVLEEPGLHADIRLDVLEALCHLCTPEAHAQVRQALPTLGEGAERYELEALLEECAAVMAGEARR